MGFQFHQSHSLPLETMHGGRFHSSAGVKKDHKYEGNKKEEERRRKQREEQLQVHVASQPADPPHT